MSWLDELPALVAGLESEWSTSVGRPFVDATEAFVAEATLENGTPAVLKLLTPAADDPLLGDAAGNEIMVLRLTDGEGCSSPRSISNRPDVRCSPPPIT